VCKQKGGLNVAGNNSSYNLGVLLIGALPNWGYSRAWGRGPSGIIGVVLIVVLILVLLGKL
jgi:hypothetical protein